MTTPKIKRICDGCGYDRPTLNLINNLKGVGLGLFCLSCAAWWNNRNNPQTGKFDRPFPPIALTEISRDRYGWDERAINRHSERQYRTPDGMLFTLSRCLDAIPKYFEAYGPYTSTFKGLTPKLSIPNTTNIAFNHGITWAHAERLFFEAVHLELS